MKLLPSRALLALTAVIDAALHGRAAPVAAKAMAARHGLTPRNLESVLQDLVRAGLLKAYRGPRGGYELARERRRITVADIVRASAPTAPPSGKRKLRPTLIERVIEPALGDASRRFLDDLERVTIDDLCGRVEAEADAKPPGVDFAI